MNPLSNQYSEQLNISLVQQTLSGDKKALDKLIHLHQPFIYNVAWKMVHDPQDAMDLTQEVLIKVITKLSQFRFKSSFRTWLYRIVVNEFLATKRKSKPHFESFEAYGKVLDSIPNAELTIEEELTYKELSKEMRIRCMSGMLMCLTREQRIIYILGDTFGIDHNLGAEIFDISKQNFRIKLHRARKELYNFMNKKCGLVNKENPCRCPKKTKSLKQKGLIDEQSMLFNISTKTQILDYVESSHQALRDSIEEKYTSLYRDHSARDTFDRQTIINEILENDDIMKYLNLS